MTYWCEDLHLRYLWESWECCYILSLLLLHQINILTICCYWLIQNLEKWKKSKQFNKLQIEVFFHSYINPSYISPPIPQYRSIKFVLCPYLCPGCINTILWYVLFSWMKCFLDYMFFYDSCKNLRTNPLWVLRKKEIFAIEWMQSWESHWQACWISYFVTH